MKEIFSEHYLKNKWRDKESRSGPGSTMAYTENLRSQLPRLFDQFEIGVVLDAPCGDFNWMQHVVAECDIGYTGCDIVPEIVEANQQYATDRIQFRQLDITYDELPCADLMICRDCLFHLSEADIWKMLNNFAHSGITYLLTTSHTDTNIVNSDIKTGGFRLLDFFEPPYSFHRDQVLFTINDWIKPHHPRQMILVSRDHVEQVVNRHAG